MASKIFVCFGLILSTMCVKADFEKDWLIAKIQDEVTLTDNGNELKLSNGLISRTFTTVPGFGTINYHSLSTQRSLIRTVMPEGYVTLDTVEYPIGGLYMTSKHSYYNASNLAVLNNSFVYTGYSKGTPEAPFPWTPGLRFSPKDVNWPPKGMTVSFHFKAPQNIKTHAGVQVTVNYEMYTGIPLLAKWITVTNTQPTQVKVDGVVIEILGTQKPYAPLSLSPMAHPWEHDTSALTSSWLYVEANVPHGALIQWTTDQASGASPGSDQPVLNCTYTIGPGVAIREVAGLSEFINTYRVLELLTDSSDLERVALSRHRMTRLLAPQTQENPIFFHGTDSSTDGFKKSIDQMSQVGFEMYIYSFGSGFKLEDLSKTNIDKIAADIQYAKSKDIEVGGYDLIDLERGHGGYGGNVGDQWDVVNPANGQLTPDACFASGWYDKLRGMIFSFINQTGLSMLETDGPYGGATCGSTKHSYHTGADDSVFQQTMLQAKLYSDLRAKDIFINQPDNYFYFGGSKSGMGYNENQYSLPRWEDISVSRQGMYDDTYHFIPTQGWMFVPLVVYHGGGAAAEFEPLSDHLLEYEWALAQYLGFGVAACYRGPRLYDTDTTMALVKKWVDFYKTYRDILISDIVHVRRPDMQDYDCILHVNPGLTNRGLAMVFNPTDKSLSTTLTLPLYYTGIQTKAMVLHEGTSPGVTHMLNRDYSIDENLIMAPKTITWFLVQSAD